MFLWSTAQQTRAADPMLGTTDTFCNGGTGGDPRVVVRAPLPFTLEFGARFYNNNIRQPNYIPKYCLVITEDINKLKFILSTIYL